MAALCSLAEEQTLCPRLFSYFSRESVHLSTSQPQHLPPSPRPSTESLGTLNSYFPAAVWKGCCRSHPRDTQSGGLGPAVSSCPSRSPPLQAGERQHRSLCLRSCCPPAAGHGCCPPSRVRIRVSHPALQRAAPRCDCGFPSPCPAALSLRQSAVPRPYCKPSVVPSAACTKVPSHTCFEISKPGFVS